MKRKPISCEELVQMSELDKETLARCTEIIRTHHGDTSPAEVFILSLIRTHVDVSALTPDDIAADLEEFRDTFRCALQSARLMARQYPALVLGKDCGSWKDQEGALKKAAAEMAAHPEDELLQGLNLLECARRAIREYPALVMSEEIPEPWAEAEAVTQAARERERRFSPRRGAFGIDPAQSKPN